RLKYSSVPEAGSWNHHRSRRHLSTTWKLITPRSTRCSPTSVGNAVSRLEPTFSWQEMRRQDAPSHTGSPSSCTNPEYVPTIETRWVLSPRRPPPDDS